MRHMVVLLASVLLAALVAVGVSVADPKRADAASSVRSCGGGTITLKTIEKKMLALHNRARADRGLPRLCVQRKLQKAARAHSADMIRRDYFSHNTRGRTEGPCERIRRYGYRWRQCAENIAWGSGRYGSPNSRFRTWMNSSGHRANILNRRFREVGIGAVRGKFNGNRGTMWTVDFGNR